MVDVTDPAAVDSLLRNAPDRLNPFIILFAPYSFFNSDYCVREMNSGIPWFYHIIIKNY